MLWRKSPLPYRTIAAFVAQRDAEALRDTLRAAKFDARVVETAFTASDTQPPRSVCEVQVPRFALESAGEILLKAGSPAGQPRQFSLQSLFVGITAACIVLAAVVQGLMHNFLGASFIAGGVAGIAVVLLLNRRGRASLQWPRAPGRITRSWIESRGSGEYCLHVGYEFQVNGCHFNTDTISFMGITATRMTDAYEQYRAEILRYPVGLEVDVFYDPDQPAVAVLQRGTSMGAVVVACAICLALIAAGIYMFLWF